MADSGVRATRGDELSDAPAKKARLLITVLDYDDLTADRTQLFRLDDVPALKIRRGDPAASIIRSDGVSVIHLDDEWSSSEHAEVLRVAGELFLRDSGSKNGTFVNGARIKEGTQLADGDMIEIGRSLLIFRSIDESKIQRAGDHHDRGPIAQLGPTPTYNVEMAAVVRQLQRIATTDLPVLILGETGSGKDVAAVELHRASDRTGPFVAVDCGAVPDNLFESIFFGHERGAFTGAAGERIGDIARAHRGSLFLDEVANLSPTAQAKLLRAIETGVVTRVGSSESQAVDVRWIAATNREVNVADPDFRSDLLHRLAGFVARIPPLRKRREDLGVLVRHILREGGIPRASMTPEAARALLCGPLSGNVRQLKTSLLSGCALAGDAPIDLADLPRVDAPAEPTATPVAPASRKKEQPPTVEELEAALEATKGNVLEAARRLSAHPRQVYRWLERFSIAVDRFRGR